MKNLLNPAQIIVFSIILIIGSLSLTSCSNNGDSEDVPPTTQESEEEQIPNETEEEIPIEPEETVFFSKMSYENFIDGILGARVEFQFEGNKVVGEQGFSPDGTLQNYKEFKYNEDGLLKTRIYYDADGTAEIIESLDYVNGNLSSGMVIRNNRQIPDTLFLSYKYSDELITAETVYSPTGAVVFYTECNLDENGNIWRSDSGVVAEIILENGMPISKTVFRSDRIDQYEHLYLESPEPKGPFSNFWGSFYGNLNNQIIQGNDNLISYEGNVDLPLYILEIGDQLKREYEFDSNDLPIRIEQTSSDFFETKTIWQIEYLE